MEKRRDVSRERSETESKTTGGKLTQTMRSLERSFQGLRKAYKPVYRARKSEDIHSTVFGLAPATLRAPTAQPLIPFHFTSAFYELSCSTDLQSGFRNELANLENYTALRGK